MPEHSGHSGPHHTNHLSVTSWLLAADASLPLEGSFHLETEQYVLSSGDNTLLALLNYEA